MRQVAAGEFKARCLAILDEVASTGEAVVVTKRGRPVARVVAASDVEKPDCRESLKASVVFEGDIMSPTGDSWEADL